MADSLIRLRQLNTGDLFNFVDQIAPEVLSNRGYIIGGDLVPDTSGSHDLGTTAFPWNEIHGNSLYLKSGEGIYFGGELMTINVTPTKATITLGGFEFFSDGDGTMIVGPSGATGATGASGASVTGVQSLNGSGRWLLSNGTATNYILLPTGARGATGATGAGTTITGTITGQNGTTGNYFRFLYGDGTTGSVIVLPTGEQGEDGQMGGVHLVFGDVTGVYSGQQDPECEVVSLGTINPDLYFIKGMSYVMRYSGLNLTLVDILGSDYETNWYPTGGAGIPSGYLKFSLYPVATDLGRYVYGETGVEPVPEDDWFDEQTEDTATRGSLSAAVSYGAKAQYKWGFAKHDFTTFDLHTQAGDGTFAHLVMGDAYFDYFAPTISGEPGAQGVPGPAGLDGPDGPTGVSVTGVESKSTGPNSSSLRFLLNDNTATSWVALPTGGPSGAAGSTGPAGPIGPSGLQGPIGPSGRGELYATSFLPSQLEISGYVGFEISALDDSGPWYGVTGTNRIFTTGDYIRLTSEEAFGGLSYTVPQRLIFGSHNGDYGYFTAEVLDFDSVLGRLTLVVENDDYRCGGCGGSFDFLEDNFQIDANLHTLGFTGPSGNSITGVSQVGGSGKFLMSDGTETNLFKVPSGAQGPRGVAGNAFVFNNPIEPLTLGLNTIGFFTGSQSAHNYYITGDGYTIQFNNSQFSTGQLAVMRVAHSGAVNGNCTSDAIGWASNIYFPNNQTPPFPAFRGQSTLYTFLRFPDEGGIAQYYCTYATNYGS